MWAIFGILAILLTIFNYIFYFLGKDYKYFMALALSFTALTLWGDIHMFANWWEIGDTTAIDDTLIYMVKPLLFLTLSSIILNMIPMFLKDRK
ncbi:MAG TPA: hypothetical protein VFC75_04665 [Erysipelothrix sp.]|nr:hypothetical protein [Erysipelothrix sp.]